MTERLWQHWTDSDRATMYAMLQAGKRDEQIAIALGRSRGAIEEMRLARGLKRKSGTTNIEEKQNPVCMRIICANCGEGKLIKRKDYNAGIRRGCVNFFCNTTCYYSFDEKAKEALKKRNTLKKREGYLYGAILVEKRFYANNWYGGRG